MPVWISPVRGRKKLSLENKTRVKEGEDLGRSLRDILRRGKRGQARIWSDTGSLKAARFQELGPEMLLDRYFWWEAKMEQ